MRLARLKREDPAAVAQEDLRALMNVDDVIEMVQKYPTVNECTHFACVMDPVEGRVVWCRRWMEPVTDEWIREHVSDIW